MIKDFITSLKEVFKFRKYWFTLIVSSIIFLLLYIYIPIFITPGNDLGFFLELTSWWQILILAVLAVFMGVLISMQHYLISETKKFTARQGGSTAVPALVSLTSGLFTSATCASCVSVIFAFLGASGVLFLLKYRWQIMWVSFILVLLSVILVSRRIQNHCRSCEIPAKKYRRKKR